jgi:hypothetical protein
MNDQPDDSGGQTRPGSGSGSRSNPQLSLPPQRDAANATTSLPQRHREAQQAEPD